MTGCVLLLKWRRSRSLALSDVQLLHRVCSAQFFASYTTLVLSSNYVTKRQSIKLLGEIILDRANYKVMTRYIASETNLKMMMNLLRDKSRNIQFEAFHVFKVPSAAPPCFGGGTG